jgi:hypothetical protein
LTWPAGAPRLHGGNGAGEQPHYHAKLKPTNNLIPICHHSAGPASARTQPQAAGSVTAGIWPVRRALAVSFLLVATALGVTGCGSATVPCPTPTTQLDRLREETERQREEGERARTEAGAWNARKEAAGRRVSDMEARLDSLAAVHHP